MTEEPSPQGSDVVLHHALLHRAVALGALIAASSAFFDFVPDTLAVTKGGTYLRSALVLHEEPTSLLVATRVVQGSALLVVFGWTNRVVGAVLLAAFAAIFNVYWAATGYPVQWTYYLPALVILLLFPSRPGAVFWRSSVQRLGSLPWRSSRTTGDDPLPTEAQVRDAKYGIASVRVWFAVLYISAFVAKARPPSNLTDYVQGGTIQRIFHDRYLDSALFNYGLEPFFDYSRPSIWFSILAAAGLLIEASAVLLLVPRLRRTHIVVAAAILGMHVALFLIGVAGFFLSALILAISVLPSSLFDTGIRRPLRGRGTDQAEPAASGQGTNRWQPRDVSS